MVVIFIRGLLRRRGTPRGRRFTEEDAKRWQKKYEMRTSIQRIAADEGIDPGTVSAWLKKEGVDIAQGQHFVTQPELKLTKELRDLLQRGPDKAARSIQDTIWGVQISAEGAQQLGKFCRFVQLHLEGLGVRAISEELNVHRTTVAEWREGTDLPYLVKLASKSLERPPGNWKWLPTTVQSGGNVQRTWIQVPDRIEGFSDLSRVLDQLEPEASAFDLGMEFKLDSDRVRRMKSELFAYLLGVLVGDAAKRGGKLTRVSSMNIDLQLVKAQPSNERLGKFVCLCAGAVGLRMHRIKDKPPSGDQLKGVNPNFAYRWTSQRSPLLGWIFRVLMGMQWGETTSSDALKMDWIINSPPEFRARFVQGLADSDGTVRKYSVEIASMPNAEFVTRVIRSLGLASAYTRVEGGQPLRSVVLAKEAASLPIFSEIARSYRYEQLMSAWK